MSSDSQTSEQTSEQPVEQTPDQPLVSSDQSEEICVAAADELIKFLKKETSESEEATAKEVEKVNVGKVVNSRVSGILQKRKSTAVDRLNGRPVRQLIQERKGLAPKNIKGIREILIERKEIR